MNDKNIITIESMVASQTGQPAIILRWGRVASQMTPAEAIAHANAIMAVAFASVIDAQIVEWAVKTLQMSPQQGVQILGLFRTYREQQVLPSVTLNLDGDHIRPDTARAMAGRLLEMAFGAEAEAFLCSFLLKELERSPAVVDQIVQEFRAMRRAVTLWPEGETDEPQS